MKNAYLLVHGAWQGEWAWSPVIDILRKKGEEAFSFDLPGSGQDNTPVSEITLESYVNKVKTQAEKYISQGFSLTLVGHSMGGAVITATAAKYPHLFKKLIYVCAFLPQDGQSVAMLAEKSKAAGTSGPSVTLNADKSLAELVLQDIAPTFFNDLVESEYSPYLPIFRPQPTSPVLTPVALTKEFHDIEKAYVVCTADRAISPVLQHSMANEEKITHIYELSAGHEPFFSCTEELANILSKERHKD